MRNDTKMEEKFREAVARRIKEEEDKKRKEDVVDPSVEGISQNRSGGEEEEEKYRILEEIIRISYDRLFQS